jgi:prepilin-type N-terminal cleavage/methylation domain-containing protein
MGVCQNCRSYQCPRHCLFLASAPFRFIGMNINKDDGFTLIEILIAITIFCFAVLGLAIGTVSVIRTNQTSHLRASAVNLAQARLEELRAMTSTAFSGLSCPSSTPCSDNATASGVTFTRQWWITANSPVVGVNRIDVTVNWSDYASQTLTFTASVPQ